MEHKVGFVNLMQPSYKSITKRQQPVNEIHSFLGTINRFVYVFYLEEAKVCMCVCWHMKYESALSAYREHRDLTVRTVFSS